ncbi:MAG: hypothetical protein KJO07_16430 [Deltaproteobacteria bacterium]|jgi:tetratricopeptide (TPR) repeat protein|nr:hypothetical protein [Deltaproteobacteria bacterium]
MLGTRRFSTRFSLLAAFTAALMALGSPAIAQDAPKQPTKEDLEKAKELAQQGAAAESNGEIQQAIDAYKKAYEFFPDPNLLIKLGDAYRKNADSQEAVDTWQKYIDTITPTCARFDEATCVKIDQQQGACVPKFGEAPEGEEKGEFDTCVGRYVEPVGERIKAVKKEEDERKAKEAEEARRVAKEAEERKKAEEAAKKAEADKLPLALSAIVMAGADQRTTVMGRLMAGGLIRFGRFAPEAHIGFEGYLRADSSQGTQAQSLTLIDLGARYAFSDEQFVGPFVAAGGGFGLFLGTPRDINFKDEPDICNPDSACTVQVDKHLNGRLGFGYGFKSGDKATVAVRVDLHTWWYSIDQDQMDADNIPLSQIDLPQLAYAVTLGLEFLRWR